ncbi:methyl-accepting chemotaxis protein [Ruminiclostridium sufflavum DSM 19573]|uniref:Methyl-accepting chemotaxis protein n=1 Tax=Ruminiclostridium sufflavum DSM 19573 TaxID=1121337 RepID=A0A318XXG1_9FIRM|nr:methyl-accepting chemotaxis protein [Ruminiclostridium sufflavum]PYG87446.1 methyl-accepting chemotaxis protein [Ruminiclostridium sufflavum DSM 19573]
MMKSVKPKFEKIKALVKSVGSALISVINRLIAKRKQHGNGKGKKPSSSMSKKIIFLRRFKIKTRLMASFVLLLAAVIVIIGVYSYNTSTNAIDEKVKNYSLLVMKQTGIVLKNEVNRMETYANEIGFDSNIQEAIVKYKSGTDFDKFEQVRTVQKFLKTKYLNTKGVRYCALLYGDDFSHIDTYSDNSSELQTEKFIQKTIDKLEWTNIQFTKSKKEISLFGIQQDMRGIYIGSTIAKIVIIPEENYLAEAFEELNIGTDLKTKEAFPIFVVDSTGKLVASRSTEAYPVNSANENSKLIADKLTKLTAKSKGNVTANTDIELNGAKSLVTYSKISENKDWYVVSVIPYDYLNSSANALRTKISVIGFVCIIMAFLLCVFIARSVSKPLGRLVLTMKKAKGGDLTDKLADYGYDEISDVCSNYNDMLENISTLIAKVRNTSQRIFSSAGKISTASESTYSVSGQVAQTIGEIAKGATEQATEISESVNIMNKLSDGIAVVDENVTKVTAIANRISGLNTDAAGTIGKLNDKSVQVSETTGKVFSNINDLSNNMNEIQKILKMQIAISEQTNLLALNASIEAARAGEAGRGFAVVASEVGKLAEKSKEFNRVINGIISSIERKTEDTVREVLKSNEVVNEQINAVKETEVLFDTVFSAMGEVVSDIGKTESSVENIMTAKNDVHDIIQNISAVAEQSAATTEEISASTQEQIASAEDLAYQAKELNELAEALNSEILKFKTQ